MKYSLLSRIFIIFLSPLLFLFILLIGQAKFHYFPQACAGNCSGTCQAASIFAGDPCSDGDGSGSCDQTATEGGPNFAGQNYCCAYGNQSPPTVQDCYSRGGYCAIRGQSCLGGYTGSQYDLGCENDTGGQCCLATTCQDMNGFCAKIGHPCGANFSFSNSMYDCNPDSEWGCCVYNPPPPDCTSNAQFCSAWSPGQQTNDCDTVHQTRTCVLTSPKTCNNVPQQQSRNQFIDSCNGGQGYTCVGNNTCEATITVHVYIDYGHDGSHDANYPFGVVKINNAESQTTGADGTVTYQKPVGNYVISYADNSPDYQQVGNTTQNVTLDNTHGNITVNFRVTPLYRISGNIFTDNNHNANDDGGDAAYTNNTTVHVTGFGDLNQADGTYDTGEVLQSGNYTVSQTHALPGGYSYTTPTSWNVTVGNRGTPGPNCATSTSQDATCGNPNDGSIANLNFGINPPYQISGRVYNDVNLNGVYDPSVDQIITTGPQIQITGPTNINVNADTITGLYSTGQVLLPGNYTVKYNTPQELGYSFEYKISSFSVVLGYNPACSIGVSTEASCGDPNGGSINNLNFDLTNENTQPPKPVCGDLRMDAGYNGFIPSTESCNGTATPYAIDQNANICPNIPGVLFSGGTNPTYGAGSGASATGQQVGNTLFPESYNFLLPKTNQSSYSFVTTTITNNSLTTPTNLTSICPNLTTCVLSEDTPGGVYETTAADGPVNLSVNNGDSSFELGQHNYVFLIGGNLTFSSDLLTPNGYTATFISGGDIHVASNVGQTDWTSTTPNLEGVFSADDNFIMDTVTSGTNVCQFNGQPLDKKLNISGSVVTNAAGNGGTIQDSRKGCLQDLTCPGVIIQTNPILLLQLIGGSNGGSDTNSILKPPYSFWQELNP